MLVKGSTFYLKIYNDVANAKVPALVVFWLLAHRYGEDILHKISLHSSKTPPRIRYPPHKIRVFSVRMIAAARARVHMEDGSSSEH